MSEPLRPGRARRTVIAVILVILLGTLFVVLYPQLQDFGAQVYRAVTGT